VSAKAKADPFVKVKTILVSSRSWLGRPSQMERELNRWTDKGWHLIDHQQIGNTKRYALVFEYRMSPEEIRAHKRRRFGLQLGCASGLVALFALAWAAGNTSTLTRNPTPTVQTAVAALQTTSPIPEATPTRVRPSATPTTDTPTLTDTIEPSATPSRTPAVTTPAPRATRTAQPTATSSVTSAATRTPRPTATATTTRRPSATPTTRPTATPTTTATATATFTPSATLTLIPSATITETPAPTATPTPAATPVMLYTARDANIRDCPRTTCAIQTTLPVGVPVYAVGLENGESVSGSSTWRRVVVNGREGFVHDGLLTTTQPRPISNPPAQQPPVQQPGLISTPVPPPPRTNPSWNFTCGGNDFNCPDFEGRCDMLLAYVNTCPGDPSRLDSEGDGRYCETQCPNQP
jgi:hypothetical protein